MSSNSPIILPDSSASAFVFTAPEVQYTYMESSRTFWGMATSFMEDVSGFGSITANFDHGGNVNSGTVAFGGGIPSRSIPNGSLLMHGTIFNVNAGYAGPHFWASFLFKIHFSHPSLGYTSRIGVWASFFEIPGLGEADVCNIFVNGWGPHSMSLNSYIGQVRCLF